MPLLSLSCYRDEEGALSPVETKHICPRRRRRRKMATVVVTVLLTQRAYQLSLKPEVDELSKSCSNCTQKINTCAPLAMSTMASLPQTVHNGSVGITLVESLFCTHTDMVATLAGQLS